VSELLQTSDTTGFHPACLQCLLCLGSVEAALAASVNAVVLVDSATRARLLDMPVGPACDMLAFIVGFMPPSNRKPLSLAALRRVGRQGLKGHALLFQLICLLTILSRLFFCTSRSASRGLRSFSSLPLILFPDHVERICF
jgi:hypothetical protein